MRRHARGPARGPINGGHGYYTILLPPPRILRAYVGKQYAVYVTFARWTGRSHVLCDMDKLIW